MRKYEAIDLMKLYSMGSANGWNQHLTQCFVNRDINALAKLKYQISAGMDDLAKQKVNTPEIDVWFTRLVKSIENTARKIIRVKHPMPGDNPLIAKETSSAHLEAKRRRDQELARFLRDSSY